MTATPLAESTSRTLVALFADRAAAERAIEDLRAAGFTGDDIGVAMRDRGDAEALAEDASVTTASGAAAGALSGGLVGGLIGLLGSLLVPGVGPVVVGGVLGSTLVGAGAGAATGGIIGALIGMGVSAEDARHFEAGVREGRVLVTVNARNRLDEAIGVLRRQGGDLGPSREELSQTPVTERTLASAEVAGSAAGVRAGYTGVERRYHDDAGYRGPERRLARG